MAIRVGRVGKVIKDMTRGTAPTIVLFVDPRCWTRSTISLLQVNWRRLPKRQ